MEVIIMIESIHKALNEKGIHSEFLDPHFLLVEKDINSIFIIDNMLSLAPVSYKTSFFSTDNSISFNYFIDENDIIVVKIER